MSAPMQRISLFEIAEEMRALEDLLDAEEGVTENEYAVIAARLDEMEGTLESKIEGYIAVIRNNELLSAGIKDEARRLSDRAKVHGNRVERLKGALLYVLEQRGLAKVETKRGAVVIAGNGGKPTMTVTAALDAMPERFTKRVIDEAAIREALEMGDKEAAKVAKFEARGKHLRVK